MFLRRVGVRDGAVNSLTYAQDFQIVFIWHDCNFLGIRDMHVLSHMPLESSSSQLHAMGKQHYWICCDIEVFRLTGTHQASHTRNIGSAESHNTILTHNK